MKTPRVSVVMPVYNGERYVRAAIDSILAQSFRDFELVILNDGSTDGSAPVIASYPDPRIVYVSNPVNTGLASVRNKGLDIARGEYIAWLDCDDISSPKRLKRQVDLLDANPLIGLCGTWVKTIDGATEDVWRYPTDPEFIRARMLFDDPIATSSIMMRAASIRERELRFNLDHPPAEDYELWERISREWGVTNIPEVLTLYRIHPMQTSVMKAQQQKDSVWAIQSHMLMQLGIEATPEEAQLHLDIGVGWRYLPTMERVKASEHWLIRIEEANRETGIFPEAGLRKVLAERWMLAAGALASKGLIAWFVYHRSKLSHWAEKRAWRAVRLFARCTLHV
jgi:glycosyltransferase involved in cell wall biosynthesis